MSKSLGVVSLLAGTVGMAAVAVAAEPSPPEVSALVTEAVIGEMRKIVMDDVVQISVKAQNTRYATLDQASVEDLDKQWRAQREQTDSQPLIARTLSNPASIFLLRKQAQALGLYSEIFLMDNKGLNVGQSSITSDYWQGDEAKWQKTYLEGGDAVFIDEAEWHDESKTWRVQVNVAVPDSQSGSPIGAVTFELNLTELERRARG